MKNGDPGTEGLHVHFRSGPAGYATPRRPHYSGQDEALAGPSRPRHFPLQAGPVLLAILFAVGLAGCVRIGEPRPHARNGVIDLTHYDFQRQGPADLSGQWEVYWNKGLSPTVLAVPGEAPQPSVYATFPGAWSRTAARKNAQPSPNQATFRLRILRGPGSAPLALRLFNLRDNYKLWINGRLISASGTTGQATAAGIPPTLLALATFATDDAPLDVVLWLDYRHSIPGGGTASILLGEPSSLEHRTLRVWGISLLIIGSAAVMGLYHVLLYLTRKNKHSYLYFSILCLVWIGYFVSGDETEWVIYLFLSNITPLALYKIHTFCYLLSRSIGYRFLKEIYPHEFSTSFRHVSDAMPLVFGPIVLIAPTSSLHMIVVLSFILTIVILTYSIWKLTVCIVNRRDGASYILFGYGIMAIFGINTMLYRAGFVHALSSLQSGILLQLGMLLYILSQAQALAHRFSNAFTAVESLSNVLERKNLVLSQEMAERNRLERKIIHISEEERRHIGYELHDGLCQHLTGARLHCSILEDRITDGPAAGDLARLSELLDTSVDAAYDLSRGLWPGEPHSQSPTPSLEALVSRLAKSSDASIELRQELRCAICHNPHATPLFRIAQEALTNAIKHAKASHIAVTLTCTGGMLVAIVIDNGIGRAAATTSKGGLGLEIMAHRARIIEADFEISDVPGGGTAVRCAAPCPHPAPRPADA